MADQPTVTETNWWRKICLMGTMATVETALTLVLFFFDYPLTPLLSSLPIPSASLPTTFLISSCLYLNLSLSFFRSVPFITNLVFSYSAAPPCLYIPVFLMLSLFIFFVLSFLLLFLAPFCPSVFISLSLRHCRAPLVFNYQPSVFFFTLSLLNFNLSIIT